VKLKPRIRATAQRTLTKFGPLTLRAASGKGKGGGGGGMDSTLSGQSFMLNINKGFCNSNNSCTVLGGKIGAMFEDGTEADPATGIYIHHVLTFNKQKKATPFLTNCGSSTPLQRPGGKAGFVGSSEDTGREPYVYTTRDGKHNSGYHMSRADTFLANVQLVNYNTAAKRVYVTYDLEWVPGTVGSDTKSALLSVTQCPNARNIRTSTAGPVATTSGAFTFLEAGTILTARGHLHDGGVKVDFRLNNKALCTSAAKYGGEGHTTSVNGRTWETINEMTPCYGPLPVKKGDKLSFSGVYDLKAHPLRASTTGKSAGVMLMGAIYFAPSK